MVRVMGFAESTGVTVEVDPWIPLTLRWHEKLLADVLYLMVTGRDGGYVELNIDSRSGALVGLIIVDLPAVTKRGYDGLPDARDESHFLTLVLDLGAWTWKTTPDYAEPKEKVSEATSELEVAVRGQVLTLWFSPSEPVEFVGGGPVRMGLSADGQLSCLVALRP